MSGFRQILGTAVLAAFAFAPLLGARAAHADHAASALAEVHHAGAHHESADRGSLPADSAPASDAPSDCPMPWGSGGCMLGATCLSGIESGVGTETLGLDQPHGGVAADNAVTPRSRNETPDRPPPKG